MAEFLERRALSMLIDELERLVVPDMLLLEPEPLRRLARAASILDDEDAKFVLRVVNSPSATSNEAEDPDRVLLLT